MSLYSYKVRINDGTVKKGRRTAKTADELRKRLAGEMSIAAWLALDEVRTESPTPPGPKPVAASKLGKMLYLQSGKCFFCGRALKSEDASIEHLLPRSKGGGSTEDNEVVCCKALNHTFGNMDLKAKFRFALDAAGKFQCPMA